MLYKAEMAANQLNSAWILKFRLIPLLFDDCGRIGLEGVSSDKMRVKEGVI